MKARVVAALLAVSSAALARAASPPTVTLLAVGDLEAQLEPHPEAFLGDVRPSDGATFPVMGGFARLRTVLDRERGRAPPATFVVAGGDTFHGSGPAAWTRGEIVTEPLRALSVDVGGGAPDIAWGAARHRELARRAGMHVAGWEDPAVAGLRDHPPWVTVRRGGATVVFLGVPSPPPELRSLRQRVAALRSREGPDVLVALVRSGVEASRLLARDVPGIDVILSGGTGERTRRAVVEGKTVVVQAGGAGSFVARVDLALTGGGPRLRAYRLVPVDARVPADPGVAAVVRRALRPWRDRMRRVVGHTATPIVRDGSLESSAENLVSDAIREIAGAQVAIAHTGGAGVPIPPGPITEGQLWSLFPADADAPVVAGWVTGLQLIHNLEREMSSVFARDAWSSASGLPPGAAGVEVTLTPSPPPGQRRVWSVQFQGALVRHDVAYTFATHEPRRGAAARFHEVQELRPLHVTVYEALLRYLAAHPVVRPRREGRIAAIDAAPIARQDVEAASSQRRWSSW